MQIAGDRLYVALSGSPKGGPNVDESSLPPPDRAADGIGVVDLDQLVLLRTIESGQDPETFALVDPDTLVVSNEETGDASIVDLRSRAIRRVAVGGEPEGVAIAPDGMAWVTSEADGTVAIIDPAAAAVVTKIEVGSRPRSVAFTKTLGVVTGENDASVTLVDVASRAVRARIVLPTAGKMAPRPMGVAISRDGKRAYVTTGRAGSVAVLDLEQHALVRSIEDVGTRPWGITLGRDGLLYTANGPSDDVAAIDPESGRVIRRFATGKSPWGIVAL
jgi:YVTN family beta-propeller protein